MPFLRGDSQFAAAVKHELTEASAVVERGEEGEAPCRVGSGVGRHGDSGKKFQGTAGMLLRKFL
jgi:hypothetical protein